MIRWFLTPWDHVSQEDSEALIRDARLLRQEMFDIQERIDKDMMPRHTHQKQNQSTIETKNEPGKRYDAGKLRYDLVPVDAMREVVKVYTKGAEKYAARNWEKGMSWSRVMGPLMRHLEAYREGYIWDDRPDAQGNPGTGCHHMAMVAWNALALISYHLREIGENDLGWELQEAHRKGQNEPTTEPKTTTRNQD